MTTVQKIADIEAEMARTQKNKATSAHLGMLKAKLAKLKRELIEGATGGSGGGGKHEGFEVMKSGDARVGLVGFPSVGKSTLLTCLTDAESEVASYEFTTLTAVPGVIRYKGAKIQLVDLPGIIEGAKDGKGRGRQVIGVARTCSLIMLVLDVAKPLTHKKIIENELDGFGIRLNKRPPKVDFRRKETGGIGISRTIELTQLTDPVIKAIAKEYRINCATFSFHEDVSAEELIDVIEGNRAYIPCIYVMNKIDAITIEELELTSRVPHYVPVSAHHLWGIDDLLAKIWEYLALVRVYTKPKGQIPDYDEPVIMPTGLRTVAAFCNRLHKSILPNFKHALVWGTSVKHQPQKCGAGHVLHDEDVVQIIKKM